MTAIPSSPDESERSTPGAFSGAAAGPLLACVPNVSEGRDEAAIDALAAAAASVPGAALLHVDPDPWHHRTVLTLAGRPEAAAEAVFRLVREAVDRIDLTAHSGQHPRIGAADVVPFVPLEGLDLGDLPAAGMDACVATARSYGRRIADELDLPVFLYGEAALREGREAPAPFRKGGFEALRESIAEDPTREPDLGPRRVHPTAGAVAVGARPPLVAFNVYLATDDVEAARRIARRIRTSGGGLPALQALGFAVRGQAQVSMNLLDLDATPPLRALEAVREEAEREGVATDGSEIVGLLPARALPEDPDRALALRTPAAGRVLEDRIRESLGGG